MILSAHQTNFLPSPILIEKIKASDIFVWIHGVKFQKSSWMTRNKIRINNREKFITVSCKKNIYESIDTTEILYNGWNDKAIKSFQYNYKNWIEINDDILKLLKNAEDEGFKYLWQLNDELLKLILNKLNIETIIVHDFNCLKKEKNSRLIDLCRQYNCKEYISSAGSIDYIIPSIWEREGIKHTFQDISKFKMPMFSIVHYLITGEKYYIYGN